MNYRTPNCASAVLPACSLPGHLSFRVIRVQRLELRARYCVLRNHPSVLDLQGRPPALRTSRLMHRLSVSVPVVQIALVAVIC
jgi:hypothetical protein